MADRYLYVAGIWIIFPAVYYLFIWLEHKSKELVAVIGISAIALTFSIMTFVRNAIWLSDYNFFSAIVDTYPNSAVAQYSIGVEYMRMGNYTEAEKHMEKAVQLDPGNFKAWYDKGTLHLHKHQPAECLDALNKCLSIKEYPKAYLTRAIVYQSTGRQELALADIEKVLAQEPQNAKAWFIKAGCLEQLGQGNEAIRLYSKAILYDSTDPALFIRRGLLYARTMQNEAALSDLNTAVEQNPDNGEALYFRGIVKFHIGQNPCDDFMQALNHGYKQASDAIAKVCGH